MIGSFFPALAARNRVKGMATSGFVKDFKFTDKAQQAFGRNNTTWSLSNHKDYRGRRSDVL
jgi:hypothetical protein